MTKKKEVGKPTPTHKLMSSPVTMNAFAMAEWSKQFGELDVNELCYDLDERAGKITRGETAQMERMLFLQAMTLQTLFVNLSRRASAQPQLLQFQTHLNLALKAQAQCRATLETLAEVKNPRHATFIRNTGQQQVNIGANPAHGEIPSPTNELLPRRLEDGTAQLDTGAASGAGRGDTEMATVGEVHRADNTGRKRAVGQKRR